MTPETGRRGHRAWGGWREGVAAWALAAALVTALMLVPNRDSERPAGGLWSLAPAAGGHVRPRATDSEGPMSEESCSDRDYANERC